MSSKVQKTSDESEANKKPEEGESSQSKPVDEAEAWKDAGSDVPVKSREMEFQDYLNDLFI